MLVDRVKIDQMSNVQSFLLINKYQILLRRMFYAFMTEKVEFPLNLLAISANLIVWTKWVCSCDTIITKLPFRTHGCLIVLNNELKCSHLLAKKILL